VADPPWVAARMPLPTGNTVGLAGWSQLVPRMGYGPYDTCVALGQAFPIRAAVPVGAGFHPTSPRCLSGDTLTPRSGTIVSVGTNPISTSSAVSNDRRRWGGNRLVPRMGTV